MDDDDTAADVADLFARLRANRPEDAVTDDDPDRSTDDADTAADWRRRRG